MPSPPNVFISHTTQDDRDFALAHFLARGLRERGAQVWIAPENIPAGAQWEQEIISSVLEKCTHFLVILSAASITSEWVLKEIELARRRHNQNRAFRILPLRVGQIRAFPSREFISQFQELKYHQGRSEQLNEVAAALGLSLATWPRYLQVLLRELEYVELSPVDMEGMSMDSFSPVNLTAEEMNDDGVMVSRTYRLPEAVNKQARTLVIGSGGSGKTTALRWLAFTMAKQRVGNDPAGDAPQGERSDGPIPVLVELSRYEGSLVDHIRKTLEVREVKASETALIEWLDNGRMFLLLDGFDEVGDKRRFVADLKDLALRAPAARIALTSRATQALITHPLPDFARYEVGPLDDAQITAIFRMRLGHDRAEELFRVIENQNLLEAVRQPLMAWLISLAYTELTPEQLPLARGVLYQTVIDKHILRIWEAKHYQELVDYWLAQKIECLARIGYEMVLLNASSLEEGKVEEICRRENVREGPAPAEVVAKLLGHLYTTDIVKNAGGKVLFWHLSFRDYFAAVWLKNHFNLWKTLSLSWQPQWHDTLIMLAGLLEDSQAKSFLRWMLRLSRLGLIAITLGPRSWADNQLFLTVSCLCNTRRSYPDLKDSLVELITGRTHSLYLSAASVPMEQILYFSGVEKPYFHFYMLVGRLGTERSLDYLRRENIGRRSKICGLAQFREIKFLLEELKGATDTDSLADNLAAYFILTYPPDTLLSEFEKFFEENGAASKKRLVSAVNSVIQHEEGGEGRYKRLGQDERWLRMLMRLALYDAEEEVRDGALAICRAFGAHQFHLPAVCETILLEALGKEEAADVRERALWYLVYATSSQSLGLLVVTLGGENTWAALGALEVLKRREREKFPYHMARFLKQLFGSEFEKLEQFQTLRRSIQSEAALDSEENAEAREAIPLLLGGACFPTSWLIRSLSAEALFLLRFEFTVPYLAAILVSDENEHVRKKALHGLTFILKEKAEPFVHHAFEDSSPSVRDAAVHSFYGMPDELRVRALPRLRALMEGDADDEVRRSAQLMVDRPGGG
jgi:hypothetical protein